MRKTTIYVDTSVIGGCCDPESEFWSKGLLSDFKAGIYFLLLSDLVDSEIVEAPAEVKAVYRDFIECAARVAELDAEAAQLANEYVAHGALTESLQSDARHIAIATVAGADVLVSWNFKHIVRFDRIRRFNGVNLEMGYKTIAIHSPREVTTHGRERS